MTQLRAILMGSPSDGPADLDIVSGHLHARHRDRRLTLAVAGILSVLIAGLALHGMASPVPDATFSFRV